MSKFGECLIALAWTHGFQVPNTRLLSLAHCETLDISLSFVIAYVSCRVVALITL